jgi:hypothetical protein
MNAAHLHLLLVHIPVVVVPLGCIVLLCGVRRDSLPITRTALTILLVASLIAIPTFLSGGEAEEIVEHLPGISEHLIEEHEEAADIALWLTLGVGVLSLLSLLAIRTGAALERTLLRATLLLSCVSSAALAYTANEGGRIRHPEAFSAEQPTEENKDHD